MTAPRPTPPMTPAEVRGFLAALQRANPDPRSELEHADPFTLLVAVVLSAQATDAAVNKATTALFAEAPHAGGDGGAGRGGSAQHIRAIGLWQGKARNVVALSRLLVERHGGEVPRDREALEALPGVGRKTANVVLNVAFGEPTMAVDTHIFRVGNRTGIAPGETPRAVEDALLAARAPGAAAPRASLADPARTLRVQGADAGVLALRGGEVVPLPRQGRGAQAGRQTETAGGGLTYSAVSALYSSADSPRFGAGMPPPPTGADRRTTSPRPASPSSAPRS